jgi:large subunit ribosomal protein L15
MEKQTPQRVLGLGDLSPAPGSKRKPKRVGRGAGSGHGKTATRGTKGQKSRSGGKVKPGFEGGQMPIQRRLPKRGFRPLQKPDYALVNIRDLKAFESGATVDGPVLIRSGLLRRVKDGIKLLGHGDIQVPLFVKVNRCSQGARQKIEAVGGTVEVI